MNLKTRLLKLQTRSKIVIAHALRWIEVWGRVYLRGVPQLILVALLLVPVVYLSGRYIEAFFQIIALFALRYKFPKTYHAKTTMRCTFLTLTIGYIAIPSTLPLNTVLFSSIFVSFVIAFLSWAAQEFIDRRQQHKEFSIYSCSRDEFNSFCLEKGIRRDRLEYVWDLFRSELGTNALSDKYFVAPQMIKQDRWRYKKKLSQTLLTQED